MNNNHELEGAFVGYAVVTEGDTQMDFFGNFPKDSVPLVWESRVFHSRWEAEDMAKTRDAGYGRRIVVKLTFEVEIERNV